MGDPIHLLLRQPVLLHHVRPHVGHPGERLLTEGTSRLARVLLHVLGEVAPVAVGDAADGADAGSAAWKTRRFVSTAQTIDRTIVAFVDWGGGSHLQRCVIKKDVICVNVTY